MLSPCHFKVGKWRAYVGVEEGWLKERGQSERIIRGKRIHTNQEPSSRLQNWGL
jgi:hypothetical protein